jgi:hypothetical protein
MSDRDFQAVLDEVSRGLSGGGWTRVREDPDAEWFGPFVSAIVLAIGLRPIEHFDSGFHVDADGLFAGKVVAFTPGTIVFADVKGATDDPHVTTRVIARPRSGLVQLTIEGGASAYGRTGFDPWPGDFRVTAEWDNGQSVTFPLGVIEFDEQRNRFMALYTALSDALGAPGVDGSLR